MKGKKNKPPISKRASSGKRGKRGPRPRYDWTLIRQEYIIGLTADDGTHYLPSYRDLERRHGPRNQTVQKRAAAENWIDLREQEQAKLQRESISESRKVLAKKCASLNIGFGEAAEDLLREVRKHIDRVEKIRAITVEDIAKAKECGAREEYEKLRRKLALTVIPSKDISQLATSMKTLQQVVALGAGEPTEIGEHHHQADATWRDLMFASMEHYGLRGPVARPA